MGLSSVSWCIILRVRDSYRCCVYTWKTLSLILPRKNLKDAKQPAQESNVNRWEVQAAMSACWHAWSTDLLFYQTPSRTFFPLWCALYTEPYCYGELQTQEAATIIIPTLTSLLIVETKRVRAMAGTCHSEQKLEAWMDRGLVCVLVATC